ncbi:MAG: hypothetical protein MUO31_07105 [Thermodesulfovibrionales bacterium]|nr:hypothetical protein [Thermodesulfovibrionales bacterium]
MSIFLDNGTVSIPLNGQIGRDYSVSDAFAHPSKAVGDNVFLHSLYREIDTPSLNEKTNGIFVIYKKAKALYFVRLDANLSIKNAATIVCDEYEMKNAQRYAFGGVSYCIDTVKATAHTTQPDFLKLATVVGHGDWSYLEGGEVNYVGTHMKMQSLSQRELDYVHFQMYQTAKFSKIHWDMEQINEFAGVQCS